KANDVEAQEKCKSIHHTDVDLQNTEYLNYKCLLNCNIHSRIWTHMMNEDMQCPGLGTKGVCKSGSCVQERPTPSSTPAPNPNSNLGFIDIEMESASIARPINAYATVCIQNFTVDMTLPMTDRSQCTTCLTGTVPSSTFPVWKSICSGSGKLLFVEQSRVTFEVFDNFATGNQVFVGGASLTIPQLLSHGDNHKRLHLALVGGHIAGQINARVTFSPKT
ncbi:hypothetical protein TYRP_010549, partial [Tyrophagus putrescentiae]